VDFDGMDEPLLLSPLFTIGFDRSAPSVYMEKMKPIYKHFKCRCGSTKILFAAKKGSAMQPEFFCAECLYLFQNETRKSPQKKFEKQEKEPLSPVKKRG
jgi:hypothetical protein